MIGAKFEFEGEAVDRLALYARQAPDDAPNDCPVEVINLDLPNAQIMRALSDVIGRYRPKTVDIGGAFDDDKEAAWFTSEVELLCAMWRTSEDHGEQIAANVMANDDWRAIHGSGTIGELAEPGDVVVVVGAGPSLNDSLPALRRHVGKVRTFVADRAIPRFRAAGLTPNVAVGFEWRPEKVDLVKGYLTVMGYASHTGYARAASRVVFTRGAGQKMPQWVPSIPDAASTTGYAIRVAILAHARAIVLVGCDCAFDGETYLPPEEATIERDQERKEAPRKLPAIGGDGYAYTDQQLFGVWLDMAKAVKSANEQGIKVCNATTRGARIPGTYELSDLDKVFPDEQPAPEAMPEIAGAEKATT